MRVWHLRCMWPLQGRRWDSRLGTFMSYVDELLGIREACRLVMCSCPCAAQRGMLPRVDRRVTLMRMDPALREQPVSKPAGKKRKGGAGSSGRSSDSGTVALFHGGVGDAPKGAADLKLEDIVGGPSPAKARCMHRISLKNVGIRALLQPGCPVTVLAGGGAGGGEAARCERGHV